LSLFRKYLGVIQQPKTQKEATGKAKVLKTPGKNALFSSAYFPRKNYAIGMSFTDQDENKAENTTRIEIR